jgi:ABC-type lipoprotein release transport system permease subunit
MLKTNLKIALRNLLRNKVYGTLNIAGLALSIACGILIYTLITYHLSFDNFHQDSSRIYRFVTNQQRGEVLSTVGSVPPAFGKAFRDDYQFGEAVARVANFYHTPLILREKNELKKFNEDVVAFAEPSFFDIFHFPLVSGDRSKILAEPGEAVVTESFATKYFGKADPMGQTIWLDDKDPFKVTGVLRDLPDNTDFRAQAYFSWASVKSVDSWIAGDASWGGITDALQCFVRLRPGVNPAQVEQVLPAYVKKYRPTSKNVHHYKLQPLAEMHFDERYGGPMDRTVLWALAIVGIFLLVTACVNFVNLATAQALRRSREVGIRKVLGSRRKQLFWQFMAETAIISTAATVAGLALARLFLPIMNEWLEGRMSIQLWGPGRLALFVFALTAVVTFMAGAYPGLILSGFQPALALKGKLTTRHIGGFNLRRALIVTQFVISFVLLISMIVVTEQMRFAQHSDLGFTRDAVVMVPSGDNGTHVGAKTLAQQISQIPGVEAVTFCTDAPSSNGAWRTSIHFDARADEEPYGVTVKSADDKYVPTFGLQLSAGRNLFPSDSVRECLINEMLLHKLGLHNPEEAIGRKIHFNGDQHPTIVGVLKDWHDRSFHEDINPLLITTMTQNYDQYAVRLNMRQIGNVLPAIEKDWNAMNPEKIYVKIFLDEQIAEFYALETMLLRLIRVFSLIAIFIGILGSYGLVTFMVAQRTKEIGIRKVLGSSVGGIFWIFGKEWVRLIAIAFLVAGPIGWMLMHGYLQFYKYRITLGPGVFLLAIAITLAIAALTIGWKSLRAARANPVRALRAE